jgi:hypothetical protein
LVGWLVGWLVGCPCLLSYLVAVEVLHRQREAHQRLLESDLVVDVEVVALREASR